MKAPSGKNAFVVGCFDTTDNNQVLMTIAAARSLRAVGNKEDIIITCHTSTAEQRQRLEAENIRIHEYQKIDYPNLHLFDNGSDKLLQFDAQKFQAWELAEYDKILFIDNDIICNTKFDNWGLKELTVSLGPLAPFHTGIMVLQPNHAVYITMRHLLQTLPFTPEEGWNNTGPINTQWPNWKFQCAAASQGFLLYYFFKMTNSGIFINDFPWFNHYAGLLKFTPEYQEKLKQLGITDYHVPEWAIKKLAELSGLNVTESVKAGSRYPV